MQSIKMSELVSKDIEMKKDPVSGKYFGQCPFCHAKTVSFSVDNENDVFFCYICGTGGNQFDYLTRMHGCDSPMESKKPQVLLDIYEDAAKFYYENLITGKNPGATYFYSRGLNNTAINHFGLGFAPDSFSVLYKQLIKKYRHSDLMQTGLFRISRGGYPYDFFRNRVIYPIFDRSGNVIAFGGRVLDDSKPKYINSPESELFSKRKNLYGFPYTEQNSTGLILCEGYMDCIRIQEAGISDCAATLGTAITAEHAKLIKAFYSQVYLSMDSDEAGIMAAKKSIDALQNVGLAVSILDFKPAKDPDEFILKFGAKSFLERISSSLQAKTFLARHAESISDLTDVLVQSERQ